MRQGFGVLAIWAFAAAVTYAETLPHEAKSPRATPGVEALLSDSSELLKKGLGKAPEIVARLERALAKAEEGLEQARKDRDQPGIALALAQKGRCQEALESPGEALATWYEASGEWERIGDVPKQIEAIMAEVRLQGKDGAGRASDLLTRAIRLTESDTSRPIASAIELREGAAALTDAGDFKGSRLAVEAALRKFSTIAPGSRDVGQSLHDLMRIAKRQGDLASARDYGVRALEVREALDPESREVALTLNILGTVEEFSGNFEEANDYYQRGLEIRERLGNASDIAGSLNNMGLFALRKGEVQKAYQIFTRILDMQRQVNPFASDVAMSLNNLGDVVQEQGDYAAARDLYSRALEMKDQLSEPWWSRAPTIQNLGALAMLEGDLETGRTMLQRALEIYQASSPSSYEFGAILRNLGAVNLELGDIAAASDLMNRSLSTLTDLAPESLEVSWTLNGLGDVARKTGDLGKAQELYEHAIKIQEAGSSAFPLLEKVGTAGSYGPHHQRPLDDVSLGHAKTLTSLGSLAVEQKRYEAAAGYLTRAWDIIRRQRTGISGSEAQRAFGAHTGEAGFLLADVQTRLGRAPGALETIEQGRTLSIYELSVERLAVESKGSKPLRDALKQAVARMNHAHEALAFVDMAVENTKEHVAGKTDGGWGQHKRGLAKPPVSAHRSKHELANSAFVQARLEMEHILANLKESVTGLSGEPSSIAASRQALPMGSLYAAFAVGADRTLLFLVPQTPNSPMRALAIPLGEKALSARVARLRTGLTRAAALGAGEQAGSTTSLSSSVEFASESAKLFRELFPESVRRTLLAAPRLIISPDGPLWELPFAALETAGGATPRWLGLDRPISYAWSLGAIAADARRVRSAPSEARKPLVVGNPMLSQSAATESRIAESSERGALLRDRRDLPPLPWTGVEAEEVGRIWGAPPMIGEAATEAAVRARMESSTLVHLATHGLFDPRWPMSSGVLLSAAEHANPKDKNNDGVLQAWEIQSELKLSADLVVLSACESGLGETTRGEGVVGLTRAVLTSGAKSVVATQWRISDGPETEEMMVAFHTELKNGMPKDEALRAAQVRTAGKVETAHPYYWAGAFLMGDPVGRIVRRK